MDILAITLPHCVVPLSWQNWDATAWEDIWLYRRRFSAPAEFANRRVFLKFDGVMVTASPSINGTALPTHQGGYLPFTYELTSLLRKSDNVLDLKVDSRFQNVPPEGSPRGHHAVDYFLPGGIIRGVSLYAVPQVFINDVFAKPVDVLQPTRRVEIACSIDAAATPNVPVHLEVKLMDGARVVSSVRKNVSIAQPGKIETALTLSGLGAVKLWDVDSPRLYHLVTTLFLGGKPIHDYRTRIGFREAKFTVDGFFLNGRRLRLFGLNRHEIYPYAGYAMPPRVMRRDAEIIRNEFHCNIVRCSHYPQSEAFLDACDELGLMVWEETPGWNYVGDAAFEDLVVQNVGDMIRRDRNRTSIVIWGVRVNESRNNQPLYRRTTALAKLLDDSRPDSVNLGTGSLNGVASMYADVLGFLPLASSGKGVQQSEQTFHDLYNTPLRKTEFDHYGIWTQNDVLAAGLGSSPSYGQGYATQAMLLFDKLDMAEKALSWLANATYKPVPEYKLHRASPYYFYERTYSPDAVGKIDLAEGCGALNLVNVSEPLKVSRLLLGVDDLVPQYVRIIPRIPPSWKGVEANNWPIRTDRGVVRAAFLFERKGTGAKLSLKLAPGQVIDDLKVRMPSENGYVWFEQKHARTVHFVTQ